MTLFSAELENLFSADVNEALLYAQPAAIVGVELEFPSPNYMPVITSKLEENISAVDVHAGSRTVYWTGLKTESISRAVLNHSKVETLIDAGMSFLAPRKQDKTKVTVSHSSKEINLRKRIYLRDSILFA